MGAHSTSMPTACAPAATHLRILFPEDEPLPQVAGAPGGAGERSSARGARIKAILPSHECKEKAAHQRDEAGPKRPVAVPVVRHQPAAVHAHGVYEEVYEGMWALLPTRWSLLRPAALSANQQAAQCSMPAAS